MPDDEKPHYEVTYGFTVQPPIWEPSSSPYVNDSAFLPGTAKLEDVTVIHPDGRTERLVPNEDGEMVWVNGISLLSRK